ncbi:GrdX family protein [Vagococcus intermedius]|uniref:GrdX family protein n=1 Tax=Vagococcus intermedius TaxID=2991418 RepID=A0AAF0CWB7_9ENTE|nr:GrdX family protein [Vagococcus intermedius]WEG74074.1 GrdX family protein [Vagococcus intermedius]WEG76154.1 GrdX family protein [Vagococcus intermedius]
MLIVTNNPMITSDMTNVPIRFKEIEYVQVLSLVRALIVDEKMILVTHPLSGSIKPNETKYKSIILEESKQRMIDLASLEMIESAQAVYDKFNEIHQRPNWSEKILKDFAWIDFYIMQSTCQRIGIAL